ncbi:ras-associated and pleckstrin homology domains-containing protein 1 isoform X2 [Stegostoma tigrinum]|uniref:ras-associated and pleckstrin homology domains-containing protein 1 isoform X2 n=1 Tax=Stegostoma tigrinum TaxID=3053191 RepID=UPI00202B0E99|nr:ras-associated and pleckstrin homology domains-containing protein 1 isoform X2 [Stegostoma tigrinum]
MDQTSDEDVDHAAEEDSDKEDQDLDKMFGAWLGELDKLTQSLDTGKPEEVKKSPLRQETNLANFSYRFSMYNLNEALSQGDGVDLDALMADLCSMEQELSNISKEPSRHDDSVVRKSHKEEVPPKISNKEAKPAQKQSVTRASSKHGSLKGSYSVRSPKSLQTNLSLDDITAQLEQASLSMDEAARQTSALTYDTKPSLPNQHRRTGSAGTVSDTDIRSNSTSSRSSVTSATSSQDSLDIDKVVRPQDLDLNQQGQPTTEHASSSRHSKQVRRHLDFVEEDLELRTEEQAARQKAEKIRVALEKIKEAQIKKLVIRVHMSDESSKTMMVDERQTVRQVLDNLMDKSHCGFSSDWSLVETIPELQMERIFEDHENLVENLLNWTRDSQNKLMFTERIEKYALFKNPQNYLLGKRENFEMGDRNKEALLEEFFCGSSVTVPEIEGLLWLKEDGKKSWKKRYFLLRASGIYYVPKGKTKTSRDLACFIQLDHVNVYYGQDYRSKYKAPTDYCCALKHPQIQKKSQYIKYLCCDDIRTLHQWVNGIRIAKYGKQLYDNYHDAVKRAEAAYEWSSLSSASMKSGSSSSSLPESHSNHSNQSDSGVSDLQSTGHVRSQSIVSSIFSEAWKRGTQLEEQQQHSKIRTDSVRSYSSSIASTTPQTRISAPHVASQSSPPPPPPPPPPPAAPFNKYSTISRQQASKQPVTHSFVNLPTMGQQAIPPAPPSQLLKPQLLVESDGQSIPLPVPLTPPPPPPIQTIPAVAALKPEPSSPSPILPAFTPPPPPQKLQQQNIPAVAQLLAPPPPPPPPPPPLPAVLQATVPKKIAAPLSTPANHPPQTAPKPAVPSVVQMEPFPTPPTPPTPPPTSAKPPKFSVAQMQLPAPTLPSSPHLPAPKQVGEATDQVPIPPPPPIVSIVKQSINQFQPPPPPPPPPPAKTPATSLPAPMSPPAVKAKPKWQPSSLPSPEFPPPPPESSLPQPPPPAPTPPPTPIKSTSVKKPKKTSSPSAKKPPPTPQRHSSIKGSSSADMKESRTPVEPLCNKFEQPTVSLASPAPDATASPPAPSKPGKLNLAAVNLMFPPGVQPGKGPGVPAASKEPVSEFPSPPSDSDFPPPPPDLDLLPPPPMEMAAPGGFSNVVPPKVAVVNPQPQTWSKSSVKKAPPPVLPKRSDSTRLTQGESTEHQAPPINPVPVSPKPALSVQPHFLADLNRTLQRKSFTRHSSVTSARLSKADSITTMDDMVLPPPPPELLFDQESSGAYASGNISGYATLRRGPPPAPPKRGDNTKLSRDC